MAGGDAEQTNTSESRKLGEEEGDVTVKLPPRIAIMLVSNFEDEEFNKFI